MMRLIPWMLVALGVTPAWAQLDATCTVNMLSRSARVGPSGGYLLPNLPVDDGLYRLRAICERAGRLVRGQSDPVRLEGGGVTRVGRINFKREIPVPARLSVFADQDRVRLSAVDATTRLITFGHVADGRVQVLDGPLAGTIYVSSDPDVASVDEAGVVTAHTRGRVNITVINEGRIAGVEIEVDVPDDRDGDGLSDGFERRNGLDPDNPDDARDDLDGDGLDNLAEQAAGTDPRVADTDGDGLEDGFERVLGTDPRRADTDGDRRQDGDEVTRGIDPLNPDTDGDGIDDGAEIYLGLDPNRPDRTTTVTGQVLDENGAVLEGAVVVVGGNAVANTAADGTFEIRAVAADIPIEAQVRRIIAGVVYDARVGPVDGVVNGVTDLGEIRLRRVRNAIGGVIRAPDGQPVAGAQVRVQLDAAERVATSDRSGIYLVDQVAVGPVVVVATDANTGLRGRAEGVVVDDETAVIDVTLSASGTLTGQVVDAAGQSVGAGATVVVRGAAPGETTTDARGRYRFDFMPLGEHALEAFDAEGRRARSIATLSRTGEVVSTELRFVGRGRVAGLVETGGGMPVADAEVRLIGRGAFGGDATTRTGPDGRFELDDVPVGPFDVTARDPVSGLAGTVGGHIAGADAEAEVVVTLRRVGALTGVVYAADGETPVPEATVVLDPSGAVTRTDVTGRYRLENIPLGVHTLRAEAGVDRGRAPVTLLEADAQVIMDVVLSGLGALTVTVVDADGAPAGGVQVQARATGAFEQTRQGTTDPAGTVRLSDLLAGPVAISVVEPVSRLAGQGRAAVTPDGQTVIVIRLEGAGSLTGRTLAPDGLTPVPGVRVQVTPTNRSVQSDARGRYRIDNLPIAEQLYVVQALDANGTQRAQVPRLRFEAHGEVVERDLVLVGTGSVRGRVTRPDGSPAPGQTVVINSQAPGARSLRAITTADGRYRVDGVLAGDFTLICRDFRADQARTLEGTLDAVDAVVELDVELRPVIRAQAIPALFRLFDGNGFRWTVRADGAIADGTTSIFRGDFGQQSGAFVLGVGVDDAVAPFERQSARLELNNRQVSLSGRVGALEVTRKIYVPAQGYFVRYLELLTNPGDVPRTVSVQLDSHLRYVRRLAEFDTNEPPRIRASSDGDLDLRLGAEGDRWVVLNDNLNADPFLNLTIPAFGHAFDGLGGARPADAGEWIVEPRHGRLQIRWSEIELAPGQTVALMHFGVQQVSESAADSAMRRLERAPAEALVGLTAAERAAIINFDLDAGGGLPALPALDGHASGAVLEGDGETIVPGAVVSWQSRHPLFRRIIERVSDGSGMWRVDGRPESPDRIPVPVDDFDVWAVHPDSGLEAPAVRSRFGEDGAAQQSVRFGNTGRVFGEVRRADGVVASAGTVFLEDGDERVQQAPIGVDGRYAFNGVRPGERVVVAEAAIPGGSPLVGTAPVTVEAGGVHPVDVRLRPTGAVQGRVRDGGGNRVADLQVRLIGPSIERMAQTDSGGVYRFVDVPPGRVELQVAEPATGIVTTQAVTVEVDAVIERDLTLVGIGQLLVRARYPDGSPVSNAPVHVVRERVGAFFAAAGHTRADGTLRVDGIPFGNVDVRVVHPNNPVFVGQETALVQRHGQVVERLVEVPRDGPPVVALLAPDGEAVAEGAELVLQADALDDLGVARVEFLVNGELVARDVSAPFVQTWRVAAGPPGPLVVRARAVDTVGQVGVSDAVEIQRISDVEPPVVAIAAPVAGAELIEGTSIRIVATAIDDIGVDRIAFSVDGAQVGIDDTAPYGLDTVLPPDAAARGQITLRATAFDAAGNQAQVERVVQILPDAPPTLELLEGPEPNAEVAEGTLLALAVDAQDDVPGVAVELRVQGVVQTVRNQPPFRFTYALPPAEGAPDPLDITLRARDVRGQTADVTLPVRVVGDDPPTLELRAPAPGLEVEEGEPFEVDAVALDDQGIDRVEVRVEGALIARLDAAPYQAQVNMPAGANGPVELRVEAFDTAGQTARIIRPLLRRADDVAPTGRFLEPDDGAQIVVGTTDIYFCIGAAEAAGASAVDFDGDGEIDTYLEASVAAAHALLDQLDPLTTQVAVMHISHFGRTLQPLTRDFAAVRDALDQVLQMGEYEGDLDIRSAVTLSGSFLLGLDAQRTASAVAYLFTTGDLTEVSFPIFSVVYNMVAVGPASEQTLVAYDGYSRFTNGQHSHLQTAEDFEAFIDSLRFGAEGLTATVEAEDDVGIAEVRIQAAAEQAELQLEATRDMPPFSVDFALPELPGATRIELSAEVTDAAGNTTAVDPISVTVLPQNLTPVLFEPFPGVFATPLRLYTVRGNYLSREDTTLLLDGEPVALRSASKGGLQFIVPDDIQSGELVAIVEGMRSNTVSLVADTDGDRISNEDEIEAGTDPTLADTDGDGLNDLAEREAGTDPLREDTDGDGLVDGYEAQFAFNPLEPGDEALDPDDDGLTVLQESELGTGPRDPDSDNDGLTDGDEVQRGLNPLAVDSDGGGTHDFEEIFDDLTDPLDPADDVPRRVLPTRIGGQIARDWTIAADGQSTSRTGPLVGGAQLFIDGEPFPAQRSARIGPDGESLHLGPAPMGAVMVERRFYSPSDVPFSQFVRVVEWMTNPTDEPVQVTLRARSRVSLPLVTVVDDTSVADGRLDAADDWFVARNRLDSLERQIAHLYSAPNAPSEPAQVVQDGGDFEVVHDIVIPPGESRAYLHFMVHGIRAANAREVLTSLERMGIGALQGLAPDLPVVNMVPAIDTDSDGLSDADEALAGTDPFEPDSDEDGLPDGFEVAGGLDPLVNDAEADADGDGLSNREEFEAGTDPNRADTDGDGLSDADEINLIGTDPRLADTDRDGLDDNVENAGPTDAFIADSDADGLLDGDEAAAGTDPLDPDADGDGLRDGWELRYGFDPLDAEPPFDFDGDGLDGPAESAVDSNPFDADSDDDGLDDGTEVQQTGTHPMRADTDGGGRPDGVEIWFDDTDPLVDVDDAEAVISPFTLLDADGRRWDMLGGGRFGFADLAAFNQGIFLYVDAVRFDDPDQLNTVARVGLTDAGRVSVHGPTVMSDLIVGRRIWVPENDVFARVRDIFINPTDRVITVDVQLETDLVVPPGQVQVASSAEPLDVADADDDWLVTDDGDPEAGRLAVVHVISDADAPLQPARVEAGADDRVQHDWRISVPAGGRVELLHFLAQHATRAAAEAAGARLSAPDEAAFSGLSARARARIVNRVTRPDTDGDGLPDVDELTAGTDPGRADTDGDGLRDGFEARFGLDPLVAEAAADPDADGVDSLDEQADGTDPTLADTDGDGLDDAAERAAGTDPLTPDSDGDGLRDGDEIAAGSDPLQIDSDGGGANDRIEQAAGSDATDPEDDALPGIDRIAARGQTVSFEGRLDGDAAQWVRPGARCAPGEGPETQAYARHTLHNETDRHQLLEIRADWGEGMGGFHVFGPPFDAVEQTTCRIGHDDDRALRVPIPPRGTLILVPSVQAPGVVIEAYQLEVETIDISIQ